MSHLVKEWVLSSSKANSSVSAGYQSKITSEVSEGTWVFFLPWFLTFSFLSHLDQLS